MHIHVFILSITTLVTGIVPTAYAQAIDTNIQFEAESFVPKPDFEQIKQQTITTERTVFEEKTELSTQTVKASRDVLDRRLIELHNEKNLDSLHGSEEVLESLRGPEKIEEKVKKLTDAEVSTILKDNNRSLFDVKKIVRKRKVPRIVREKKTVPRKTTTAVDMKTGHEYRSNATRSNINSVEDNLLTAYGSVSVKVPIGPDEDTVTVHGSVSRVRYDELTAKDIDLSSISAGYTSTIMKHYLSSEETDGPVTRDKVSVGVKNLSIFEPGFDRRRITFTTPEVTVGREMIGLTNRICGNPGKRYYCQSATISATVGHSWSDLRSENNAALTISASISSTTSVPGLSISANGNIIGTTRTASNTDREDIVFLLGGGLNWQPRANITISAAALYTSQHSTVDAARWAGADVKPSVNLSMSF
ncbi:MAG: hypothetical protein ACRBCJ_09515 [Hyphomicrobiaceae bacterium]